MVTSETDKGEKKKLVLLYLRLLRTQVKIALTYFLTGGKLGSAGIATLRVDLAYAKLHFEHIAMRGKLRQKFSTHFMFIFKAKNSNNQKWTQNLL